MLRLILLFSFFFLSGVLFCFVHLATRCRRDARLHFDGANTAHPRLFGLAVFNTHDHEFGQNFFLFFKFQIIICLGYYLFIFLKCTTKE